MEKQKIRFVDGVNNTLFYIDDGEEIEIEIADEWIRYTCRYLDENHFKLDGRVHHIGEFAQLREKLVQRYRPAKKEVKLETKPKKKIRFISLSCKTLFYIDDGDDIEVEINGVWKRYTCKYLDECHFEIIGICYHIHEFAERLEKAGQRYRPINSKT
jgi:hypothetical protein